MKRATAATLLAAGLLIAHASDPDPTRRSLEDARKLADEQRAPAALKPWYLRLYLEGESQATLNRMRLASAAIEQGEWNEAERALDGVIRDIEALGPADERSREAMDDFESEEIKRFKGEAYERSMAYLLRGLLYIRTGTWDNARACFKSVQVFDAAKADPKLRANWASADWLEGWCNWNLNQKDAARDCWERARQHAGAPLPIPSPDDNALAVALLGYGPVKVPVGNHGEHLGYRSGNFKTAAVRARLDGKEKTFALTENLLAQATSRGLRGMDLVNEGKADTKSSVQTTGDVLIAGGVGTVIGGGVVGDTTVAAAGLGAVAAGAIANSVASGIEPKADTRAWDLLPATIQLLPMRLPADAKTLDVQFLNEKGTVLTDRNIPLTLSTNPILILILQR